MRTDVFYDTFTAQKFLLYQHDAQCIPLYLKLSLDELSNTRVRHICHATKEKGKEIKFFK